MALSPASIYQPPGWIQRGPIDPWLLGIVILLVFVDEQTRTYFYANIESIIRSQICPQEYAGTWL